MLINRITLLGHKDHGKSTLIGNLLIQTGTASEQRINDAKKTSQKLGRKFEPGFILDSFEEEREGGLTIDTTRVQINYKDIGFEFIDVPGHEELIKNMMSGASYAKFAILLVSAKSDEGIRPQTKRHLFLAKMMGINKIIIAVNKMDYANYRKDVFDNMRNEIETFLHKIGFDKKQAYFIPISAYNADNLVKISKKTPWYKGSTLMDAMKNAVVGEEEETDGKLRIIVQGVLPSGKKTMTTGKIISGTIKAGEKVSIVPANITAKTKEIFVKGKKQKAARKGENVALTFDKEPKGSLRGSVIYGATVSVRPTKRVSSIIFFTKNVVKPISIKINGNEIACDEAKIKDVIDTGTGSKMKSSYDKTLNAADVELKFSKAIIAEPFEISAELGRFVVYQGKEFVGLGIVKGCIT
ncbi:MAG: 50S ribosome-binding GTPase [Candidatus Micrarchaeota archaeon]|nr:50S ribosome-binding GTPase [Candidatus Micrarchaeota archaeon]MDE1850003.1 50S ribosome-binding GTPase [Candidatus Micrarchaeota archaeon]